MFLYVLPFIVLVLIFAYYPLYGWVYAFFDYKPPKPFSIHDFVGLKWFKSLVENPIKINQLLQVLKNTFAMSGITLATSWLPMIFAVFMNELRCVPFRKFVQTVTTLPQLHQLGACIFRGIQPFQQHRYGEYPASDTGDYYGADSFPPVLRTCMADDVAVAYMEEPGLVGHHVHSGDFRN